MQDAGTPREQTGVTRSAWRMDLGLGSVSAAILVLEILQTRIFAYSLDHLTIYLAVGVCLLGLGASATLLAILPEQSAERARAFAAAYAAAGAVAVPLAHVAFAAWAREVDAQTALGALTLLILAVPYFCFGMTTAALLVARSRAIGRAYAFNLGGAGLGCLVVFPLLNAFGAEAAIGFVAWMSLATSMLLQMPRRAPARLGLAAVALLLVLAQAGAARLFAFPPDPRGQFAVFAERAFGYADRNPKARVRLERNYDRWTETGRIEVWELETNVKQLRSRPVETQLYMQDSSAGSLLLGVGDDLGRARSYFEDTVYGAGYVAGQVRDVLVIGLGGAPDVLGALYRGVRRVVGVDINGATIDLARGAFREYLGDPYGRPEVETHQIDGRTYLRSSSDRFDLILMTGVDTKTLLATGSLSLSENYLYTLEAMRDALERLRPDGLLAVTRFRVGATHRFVAVAVEALREAGASDPRQHVFALRQGVWRAVLVKRSPFTEGEIARLHAWAEQRAGDRDLHLPAFDLVGVPLDRPLEVQYSPPPRAVGRTDFYRALGEGRLDEFIENEPLDLRPPTDDRPYLFFETRPERAILDPPPLLRKLLGFSGQLAGVSAICMLLPLLMLRSRGLQVTGAVRALVYFTCLGVGFMVVEIGLFHRFVLLLGHQSYSVTVVLFGLLLGASIGSALSSHERFARRGPASLALAALVALIVLYALGLEAAFAAAARASFVLRLTLAFAVLLPLGVALGFPFPMGVRGVRARSVPLVAWAVGVNGFASVVGSTLAVPVALVTGLRALLFAGAVLYLVALVSLPSGAADAASADRG